MSRFSCAELDRIAMIKKCEACLTIINKKRDAEDNAYIDSYLKRLKFYHFFARLIGLSPKFPSREQAYETLEKEKMFFPSILSWGTYIIAKPLLDLAKASKAETITVSADDYDTLNSYLERTNKRRTV